MIMLNMIVILMMLTMRHTPTVEGNQQGSMADVTEDVAEHHTVSERAVTAVMAHNEQTPSKESDHIPPEKFSQSIWIIRAARRVDVRIDRVATTDECEITNHVVDASPEMLLEAMLRNRLAERGEREGRLRSDGGGLLAAAHGRRLLRLCDRAAHVEGVGVAAPAVENRSRRGRNTTRSR